MPTDWKKKLSKSDWQRFFGDEGAWRNETHAEDYGESPTVSMHIKHATDGPIMQTEHYSLYIHHVRGFHGKGFIPSTRFNIDDRFAGNGNIVYGTSQAHYDRTRSEGELMLREQEEEFQKRLEEMREPQNS